MWISRSSGDRPVTVARFGPTSTPWPSALWQVAQVFWNTARPRLGSPVSSSACRYDGDDLAPVAAAAVRQELARRASRSLGSLSASNCGPRPGRGPPAVTGSASSASSSAVEPLGTGEQDLDGLAPDRGAQRLPMCRAHRADPRSGAGQRLKRGELDLARLAGVEQSGRTSRARSTGPRPSSRIASTRLLAGPSDAATCAASVEEGREPLGARPLEHTRRSEPPERCKPAAQAEDHRTDLRRVGVGPANRSSRAWISAGRSRPRPERPARRARPGPPAARRTLRVAPSASSKLRVRPATELEDRGADPAVSASLTAIVARALDHARDRVASPSENAAWKRTIASGSSARASSASTTPGGRATSRPRPAADCSRTPGSGSSQAGDQRRPASSRPAPRASRGRASGPGRSAAADEILQERDRRGIVALDQEPLGRLAPPGVGVGQQWSTSSAAVARPSCGPAMPRLSLGGRGCRAGPDPCRWSGRGAS